MTSSAIDQAQNTFHEELTRFVNGAPVAGDQRAWVQVLGGPPGRSAAEGLVQAYRALGEHEPASPGAPHSVVVRAYDGAVAEVARLRRFVARHLADSVEGVFVHGSLGSDEVIHYSDFDALVLLNEDVLQSPARLLRAGRALNRAQRIMRAFDPLQHHGWFVLTPLDLDRYCDAYFPAVLFEHARVVWPPVDQVVSVRPRPAAREVEQAFERLVESIVRPLSVGRPPETLYEVKCVFSRFMLLPALYVQARDHQGVWKKDSFDLARQDFAADVWRPMDDVSELRRRWSYSLAAWRRVLMGLPGSGGRRLRRMADPAIPPHLRAQLPPGLWDGMRRLALAMKTAHAAGRPQRPPAVPDPHVA